MKSAQHHSPGNTGERIRSGRNSAGLAV